MYRELAHTEDYKGFTIKFYLCEEFNPIDWYFDTPEEKEQLINDINNGKLLYFCAEVTASKEGIELGNDFLGSCCYKSVDDFLKDGYYNDMRNTAIDEANKNLKLLCTSMRSQ